MTFSGGISAPSAGCCSGRNLARGPDLEPPVVEVRRGVLRLERRVRQQREKVLGFDGLRRRAECGLDVTDHSAGGPRGPPRHRPGPARGGGGGVGRRRRLRRQLARLRQVRSLLCVAAAPSSQVTFSELRASLASHQLSATIATPEARELLPCPAGS